LRITFDAFSAFNEAVKTLAAAGSRGLGKIFATHRRLHGIGYKTYTKLFEIMIEPIILYGAEVWGTKVLLIQILYKT